MAPVLKAKIPVAEETAPQQMEEDADEATATVADAAGNSGNTGAGHVVSTLATTQTSVAPSAKGRITTASQTQPRTTPKEETRTKTTSGSYGAIQQRTTPISASTASFTSAQKATNEVFGVN